MKKQGLLILALLLIVLVAAYFGYNSLSEKYAPEAAGDSAAQNPGKADIEEKPEESAQTGTQAESSAQEPETSADKAPDFTVLDADGTKVTLNDNLGKPVIINFWATWCGPCRSELPAFNDAWHTYGDDITFMMVNLTDGSRDTVESVKSFVEENGYDFPVYYDTEESAAYAYSIYSIPLTVFIDAQGNIAQQHIGSMSESTLQGYIDGLMKR